MCGIDRTRLPPPPDRADDKHERYGEGGKEPDEGVYHGDDGGSGYFSRIRATALAPGDYYVKVEEYGNNGTIEVYALSLTTGLPSAPAAGPTGNGFPEPDFEYVDTPGYFGGCSPQAGRAGASGRPEIFAWLLPLAATLLAVAALRRRCMRRAFQTPAVSTARDNKA